MNINKILKKYNKPIKAIGFGFGIASLLFGAGIGQFFLFCEMVDDKQWVYIVCLIEVFFYLWVIFALDFYRSLIDKNKKS